MTVTELIGFLNQFHRPDLEIATRNKEGKLTKTFGIGVINYQKFNETQEIFENEVDGKPVLVIE